MYVCILVLINLFVWKFFEVSENHGSGCATVSANFDFAYIYIYDLVITRINKKYSSEAPIRASQLYVCTYYINKSYFSGRSRGHFL